MIKMLKKVQDHIDWIQWLILYAGNLPNEIETIERKKIQCTTYQTKNTN